MATVSWGYYQDSVEDDEEPLTLDALGFDCIVCICEWLCPEDLCRFSGVCKLFYEASLVGYLWRRHCLARWTFCDILQIPEGPQRWRRYFLSRRKVEARLDQGKPGRDYKVKTLRGHEQDVRSAVVIGGARVNWENPQPPLVVSCSNDGAVKAWDVLQAKPVWAQESLGACVAGNDATLELALGAADGSITLWDTQTWSERASFRINGTGTIAAMKYYTSKSSKLPKTILLVRVSAPFGGEGHTELWDIEAVKEPQQPAGVNRPLFELWSPAHSEKMHFSSSHLLAIPGTIGDVHVWDLTTLSTTTDPPPLPPSCTINTNEPVHCLCWLKPGVLATTSSSSNSIALWGVDSHLEAIKKSGIRPHDTSTLYNPVKTLSCIGLPSVMTVANGLLVIGDGRGGVTVIDPETSHTTTSFTDHKGAVTDLFADNFRVLSCSTDFSIRVYRWIRSRDASSLPKLESKYTLLGGSVALKTHSGFRQLLCEAGSCVGVAGNQLKFYIFACGKLDSS